MNAEDNYTSAEVREVVADFAMLKYFTVDMIEGTVNLLIGMVPHKRALLWLRDELVNHVGEWPGPKELRGLLCSRFDPKDKIDEWCTLPGYRPADCEARAFAAHEQIKAQDSVGGYLGDGARAMLAEGPAKMKRLGAGK